MVDHVLIDNLNLKAGDFAVKWTHMVRKAKKLKHYNKMKDEELIEADAPIYPILSNTLDKGLDRDHIGDFFVRLGKDRMRDGYPISEVILAMSLVERVVIEYIMTEFAPENPMHMYQSMEALTHVAEFCLLAGFYIAKGFLEETYTTMNLQDEISEKLLKKYFKDDFFFKKE